MVGFFYWKFGIFHSVVNNQEVSSNQFKEFRTVSMPYQSGRQCNGTLKGKCNSAECLNALLVRQVVQRSTPLPPCPIGHVSMPYQSGRQCNRTSAVNTAECQSLNALLVRQVVQRKCSRIPIRNNGLNALLVRQVVQQEALGNESSSKCLNALLVRQVVQHRGFSCLRFWYVSMPYQSGRQCNGSFFKKTHFNGSLNALLVRQVVQRFCFFKGGQKTCLNALLVRQVVQL